MRTSYSVNPAKAVEGQPVGQRETRPLALPWLPQITTVAQAAGAGTDALVISVVDDKTSQAYSVSVSGSANEATLLANALAAIRASVLNNLFSVTGSGTDGNPYSVVYTARHANRSYTISHSGGNGGAFTVTATQAAGGSGIRLGRFVVESSEGVFNVPDSTSTLAQVAGVLFRTDGNHFRSSLENDTPSSVDTCARGKTYPIMTKGRVWMRALEAMTVSSTVYLVCEASDSADLGKVRASASGGQQLWTLTPTASEDNFSIEFDYLGRHYTANTADEADGSYTATEICDDLRTGLGTIDGLTFGGTATLTIQTAAGTEITGLRSTGNGVFASITETTGEDVDALDISSIAKVEQGAASGGLVLLRINTKP